MKSAAKPHAPIPLLFAWVEGADLPEPAAPLLRRTAAFVGFHHGRLNTKFNFRQGTQLAAWDGAHARVLGDASWRTAQQQQGQAGGGVYVAMPTQATSNGLFPRFKDFLERGCDAADRPNLVLLHGAADLHPDRQDLLADPPRPDDVRDEDVSANGRAAARTQAWFLPKKRGLLAPYGVGTVDQTFLGVMRSRHFFLRLFGLAGKTIIFDEVHAYDTYMSRLFQRLLAWLRALGTHVVLLSATLPRKTRTAFLDAWGSALPVLKNGAADYPALWHAEGDTCTPTFIPDEEVTQRQEATLERTDPSPEAIAEVVQEAGAAVAVIVNTVARAQCVYQALAEVLDLPDEDFFLLHARFPLGQRSEREEQVRARFGKERAPGEAGVLVATQVAEQSLDLDFDLMPSALHQPRLDGVRLLHRRG